MEIVLIVACDTLDALKFSVAKLTVGKFPPFERRGVNSGRDEIFVQVATIASSGHVQGIGKGHKFLFDGIAATGLAVITVLAGISHVTIPANLWIVNAVDNAADVASGVGVTHVKSFEGEGSKKVYLIFRKFGF